MAEVTSREQHIKKRYEKLLTDATNIVDNLEQIIERYDHFLREDDVSILKLVDLLENNPVERVRRKIKSQLMNIAVCGAFSSGKSFLISGLIGRLTWYRPQAGEVSPFFEDEEIDAYSSFLPSSPEQTSSCPLAIIPGEENRSRFQVFFDDTKSWEDKSEPYFDESEIQRKMLAYVTDVDDWVAARPQKDLPRKVSQARLFVNSVPFPAIIYDLPGIGGAGDEYIEVVREAIVQSDCIVYVASAIRELSEAELDLLRFIDDVSEKNRIPVFFVLSQIDRERDWSKVKNKNDKFISQFFRKDGKPNAAFLGRGFIPLSPAVKAKALGKFSMGEINASKLSDSIDKSGMPTLQHVLFEYLTSTSGPAHLREIILHMRAILNQVKTSSVQRLRDETIPMEKAKDEIERINIRIKKLDEARKTLLEDLDKHGKLTLKAAFSTSDPDNLYGLLKPIIEKMIEEQDVLKEGVQHNIEQKKKEIRDKWLSRPKGFEEEWIRAWNDFEKLTARLLTDAINEANRQDIPLSETSPVSAIRGPDNITVPPPVKVEDALRFIKDSWQLLVSVTGIGAGGVASAIAAMSTTATTAAAVAALGPVGLLLIIAGTVGVGWTTWQQRARRKDLKEAMKKQLFAYSDQTIANLRIQTEQFLEAYKGEVIKIIDRLISSQEETKTTLEKRINKGDLRKNAIRIKMLQELQLDSETLENKIELFFEELTKDSGFIQVIH